MSKKPEDKIPYLEKIKHELNAPIHGIKSLVEYLILMLDKMKPKDQKKCLNYILKNTSKLQMLAKEFSYTNLLQTSIQFNFIQDDIVAATKKVVKDFESTFLLSSKISLILNTEINEFITLFDQFWYEQLLINILKNALNYSDKGIILVSLCLAKEKTDILELSITDQGVGIPESEIKDIFTPYHRSSLTQSEPTGTGLGLSICREIVEAHGGTIKAENSQDGGAVIIFGIPKKLVEK